MRTDGVPSLLIGHSRFHLPRAGIRTKLVATLMLAGLLPLALSLAAALVAVREAGRQSAGQALRAQARQRALHLDTLLDDQLDFINLVNRLPGTAAFLQAANAQPPSTPEQLAELDRAWPALPDGDPRIAAVLDNELARRWQAVRRHHPRISEVIITDAAGRLVAATGRTEDFYQADEGWWKACRDGDQARMLDIAFDPSAIPAEGGEPGAFVASICLPIRPTRAPDEPPAGIIKVSLDASWMLRQLRSQAPSARDEVQRRIWLVDYNGVPIAGIGQEPRFDRVPAELLRSMHNAPDGYMVHSDLPGEDVVGYAMVRLPGMDRGAAGKWFVLITAAGDELLASTRFAVWMTLAIGVLFIVASFLVGILIARREIFRPVLQLAEGARQLESGHLGHRLVLPGEPGTAFRDDEIGGLARDFNRMADRLEQHLRELTLANRVKQQFIDVASHELRTPITYIAGVAELALRQGRMEPAQVEKIAAKAARLGRIVENMFKLLQTGSFDLELRLGPVSLRDLAHELAGELDVFLKARRQTLELHLPEEGTPLVIQADREKLHDVLQNLLGNAIRFSPDGAPIVLEIARRDHQVEFVVADRGTGIAPEHLPHVFEPFYACAIDSATHSSGEFAHMTRGIGLGLSVVKRFVEMHGGEVAVESSAGGTRFRVRIPAGGE